MDAMSTPSHSHHPDTDGTPREHEPVPEDREVPSPTAGDPDASPVDEPATPFASPEMPPPQQPSPQVPPGGTTTGNASMFGLRQSSVPNTSIAGSFAQAMSTGAGDIVEVDVGDREKNKPRNYPDNTIITSKYTLLTFLPLNLWEQFHRASNFFFLLVAAISLVPGSTSISPASNVMPLFIVLIVSGAKSAYEDWKRHKADERANSTPIFVMRPGSPDFMEIPSWQVQAGDIIHMRSGEEIRADCLLLASSEDDGLAYIETANLDGETNVKTRRAQALSQHHFETPERVAAALNVGSAVYGAAPNPSLATWKGVFRVGEEDFCGVGLQQFFFRGCVLRNTHWAVVVAVYVGRDTKMFLNLKQKPPKFSHLDKVVNYAIVGIFICHQIFCILLAGLAVWWSQKYGSTVHDRGPWYGRAVFTTRSGGEIFIWLWMNYFVLLSFMIPISLFVTLEICKAFQALLMATDRSMCAWSEELHTWRFASPKTSDLNDQLAHVRYIFTDKTGTLTENRMNLDKVFVAGPTGLHDEQANPGGLGELSRVAPEGQPSSFAERSDPMHVFLSIMSLCHGVVTFETPDGGRSYEGQSPDEIALVKAAARSGYALTGRNSKQMTMSAHGEDLAYDIVAELDFTPERKRMSVILKDGLGRYILLTKGADSSMIPVIDPSCAATQALMPELVAQITSMAHAGLRTLVVGYRILDPAQADLFSQVMLQASVSMNDRAAALAAAYSQIEQGYTLVGCTGVEDKLQEAVPETIQYFARAGVVVWILTGDKRETAVTIAATSGLVDPERHTVHHIDVSRHLEDDDAEATMKKEALAGLEEGLRLADDPSKQVVLVVDGVTLDAILRADEAKFVELGTKLVASVCCRLTPLQKSVCVRLFQERLDTPVLSIGDGANDVSMIQEARVGIGVMGLEGSQAELASDYAIPQFRFLRPLLSLHGRYCWYRNATCVLYSLYKNLAISICLFLYTTYSGYSGQTVFDSWLLSGFNAFFASLVPVTVGGYDRDVDPRVVAEHPELFGPLQREQRHFNMRSVLRFSLDAVAHGLFAYWCGHLMMEQDDLDMRTAGLEHYGTAMFILLVLSIDTAGALLVARWDAVQAISVVGQYALLILFLGLYSVLPDGIDGLTNFVGVFTEVLQDEKVYLWTIFLLGGVIGVVNLARDFFLRSEFPTEIDTIVQSGGRAAENDVSSNPDERRMQDSM